jgi:hypothetical protein
MTSMRIVPFLSLLTGLVCADAVHAQHEGHGGGHVMPDGTFMSDEDMANMDMEHAEILGEPLGSGTGWLPQGSPVHDHALHAMLGSWMLRTHGEVALRYTGQNLNHVDRWSPGPSGTAGESLNPDGERGGTRFDAPNWAMVSAERPIGAGSLLLRTMLSLDPATIGNQGYPLLFQTGEGLVDRQHAHDLFMELGALYAYPLDEDQKVFVYAGLPGEPALGPTAFMHRPSAGNSPDAPLGHHFQDATHITHGVLTAGYVYKKFKADGSLFRGTEPDAHRWNIDVGALDSWSLRFTQNFGTLSLQGSVARIHSGSHDGDSAGGHGDVTRWTASLARNHTLAWAGKTFNSSRLFVYGVNAGHDGAVKHSLLSESAITGERASLWSRWEGLQRDGTELDLPAVDARKRFWVGAFSLGAGASVYKRAGLDFFLGGQAGLNFTGAGLQEYYGNVPVSAQVFLKVRPGT